MSPDWSMPAQRMPRSHDPADGWKSTEGLRKSRFPFWKYSDRSGKVLRKKYRSPEKGQSWIPLLQWSHTGNLPKKCCGNIAWNCAHRRNRNTPDHRDRKITGQSFPCQLLTALQIFSHNSVSLRYRRRRLIQASAPSFFTSDISYSHISHLFSLQD